LPPRPRPTAHAAPRGIGYHLGVIRALIGVILAAAPAAAQVREAATAPCPLAVPALGRSAAAGAGLAPPPTLAAAPALAFSPTLASPLAAAAAPAPIPAAAAAAPASAPASAPTTALVFPKRADGRPTVLRSLDELGVLFADGARPRADPFDGPREATVRVPEGLRAVEVHPRESAIAWALEKKTRLGLARMPPIDIFVYRDRSGGRFLALDLARHPEAVDRVPDIKNHEVATVRRILALTRDVQVIVVENGLTPDLVVGGTVVEMKSVRAGEAAKDVRRANAQLAESMRRHGHGLGAVVLDVEGPALAPEFLEAEIALALERGGPPAFRRVCAYNGGRWEVYARGLDGRFRLAPRAQPFPSSPPARN